MNRRRLILHSSLIAASAVAAPMLLLAHHGLAAFNQNRKVTLKGTVTEFLFVNPHCIVEFDVNGENGKVVNWRGELTSPVNLKGWNANSLEAGNEVTITGFPAKSGAPYLWILQLHSSNGTELKSNRRD